MYMVMWSFIVLSNQNNVKLPYVHCEVVFLRVNKKMRSSHVCMVKWSFFVLSNQKIRSYHVYMVVFRHVEQSTKQMTFSRRHLIQNHV